MMRYGVAGLQCTVGALHPHPAYAVALATARLASTSEFMPVAGMLGPSSDFAAKRLFSASSNDFTQNTPLAPAPLAAIVESTALSQLSMARLVQAG